MFHKSIEIVLYLICLFKIKMVAFSSIDDLQTGQDNRQYEQC